jgi:LuxR family maltose regulon positive regulatory protein
MTFARTKIQPPRPRAAFVERDALQARLARALTTQRLVLLCAPAGYGKTTLLAQQLARLPARHAVAWIAADAGDDLRRLLDCMVAALEPYDPPWRTAPEALLASLGRGTDEAEHTAAAELINTLDSCDVPHGVIVFDDVHRVDDPAFFRFLDRLVERMSARWTIVLSSRTEPPMALARLRAADELAEFRQLQLQFARDEARLLAHGAGLDDMLADRLFARTQGWPAGLRIAIGAAVGGTSASAAPERALRASERPLFEFLVTEVVDQLSPGLAQFLMRVAVLPELQAERCATVARDHGAAARLDEIERLGLFVDVLDAPTHTLRLHDLFREALLARLRQRDAQALADARRLAADTEADPVRRIGLLLDAGEAAQAAQLVLAHVPAMIATDGPATATHLIGRFPPAFRDSAPELQFVRGGIAWAVWDFPAMLAAYGHAEAGFAARGEHDSELLARGFRATALIAMGSFDEAAALINALAAQPLPDAARVMLLHAQSWLAVDDGRTREVAPLIEEMLDLLERVDRLELWYHTTTANRLPGLPGMRKPLLRHAALLERLSGDEPSTLRALALLVRGWDALWGGDFDAARAYAERARDDMDWAGPTGAVRGHLLALTALREAALGRAEVALDAAGTRARELGARYGDWGRWLFLLFVARTAGAGTDAAALGESLRRADAQLRLAQTVVADARMRPVLPLRAQLAWLEGRVEEAIAGWRAALAHEEEIEVWGLAAESRVRLARALLQQGDAAGAADTLRALFERAEREGGPGGALLASDALEELSTADWGRNLSLRQQSILRTWWQTIAAARAGTTDAQTGRATPASGEVTAAAPAAPASAAGLSTRELEVLARIAAGDSNKLIAREFDLSLHTVKRHVANILGKLGVESRGQAAARYLRQRS